MLKLVPSRYTDFLSARTRTVLTSSSDQRITVRGLWVGCFLSLFLAIAAPYNNMMIHGTHMALDISTQGALFVFLALIGLLNLILKLVGGNPMRSTLLALVVGAAWLHAYWPLDYFDHHSPALLLSTSLLVTALVNLPMAFRGRPLALNKAELIAVYVMLAMVSAVCTMGLSQHLPPMISALFYYASPDNNWKETLFPAFADRPYMVDDGNGNRLFYEGLIDPSDPVPYGLWIEPLLWWAVLLLAVYVVMISAAVILRRQWMERERLAYPIAQVGLALIHGDEQDALANRFFRNKAAWIGIAVPMFVGSLRALKSHGFPVEAPVIGWSFSFLGTPLQLTTSFSLIGFSYFIDTRVAASIWIFYLLAKFQTGLLKTFGIEADHPLHYGASESPLLAYAGLGALLCMVLVGLYLGREHFGKVLGKAFGRTPEYDDGDEILSYRSAVIGAGGGMVMIVCWFWIMGTALWVAALFAVIAILIFIGITRIIVEAGVATLQTPMIAPDFVIYGLGANVVGAAGVANLSIAYVWCAEVRAFVMAVLANALRLIQEMERESRRLVFWMIILALGIGAIASLWLVLSLGYRHGGVNLGGYFFTAMNTYNYAAAERALSATRSLLGYGFFAGGATVMGLLIWARQRLPWWPLHPVAYPISATNIMGYVAFSAFVAWALKLILLRLGGPSLYRRGRTFFLGLIAGQVMCNGAWLVIDYLTGHQGNSIFGF